VESRYRVRVAAVTANLPKFEPPLDEAAQGFETPYADRLSVEMMVKPTETLRSVYRRAVEHFEPRPHPNGPGYSDIMEVVQWAWFYEPADLNGISAHTKAWETSEDLVTIDGRNQARWNRSSDEIPFEDLVRAARHGLLRGDPLRPYLVLVLPQGGEAVQTAWELVQLAWAITGHILTARELAALLSKRLDRRRLQKTLDEGARAIGTHSQSLAQRGGGPLELARTLERKPWPLDELRMLLGVDSNADAEAILQIFGLRPNAEGLWELSEDEESRLLDLIAREAARGRLRDEWDDKTPFQRLKALLETGEFPEP
jgi:hypothetical protein